MIQFDAHQDYDQITEDLGRTNSHAFRHIGTSSKCLSLTQVGIRSLRTDKANISDFQSRGHRMVCMTDARRIGAQGIADLLPAASPVYVSIDIDALDLSIVPGCVSAEPDGLTFRELTDCLRAIACCHRVIAFDFVEVNPLLDVATGATAYLGALITIAFLGQISRQDWWRDTRDGTQAE